LTETFLLQLCKCNRKVFCVVGFNNNNFNIEGHYGRIVRKEIQKINKGVNHTVKKNELLELVISKSPMSS